MWLLKLTCHDQLERRHITVGVVGTTTQWHSCVVQHRYKLFDTRFISIRAWPICVFCQPTCQNSSESVTQVCPNHFSHSHTHFHVHMQWNVRIVDSEYHKGEQQDEGDKTQKSTEMKGSAFELVHFRWHQSIKICQKSQYPSTIQLGASLVIIVKIVTVVSQQPENMG